MGLNVYCYATIMITGYGDSHHSINCLIYSNHVQPTTSTSILGRLYLPYIFAHFDNDENTVMLKYSSVNTIKG